VTPLRKMLIGGALAGTTLAGAALGATFLGTAGAQTTDPSTTAPAAGTAPAGSIPKGPHQANGVTETALTGDDAAKVTAAAQAAVPGATVDRVETDADGAAYEAHMTKSDGTRVTVKLDSNFTVTATETDPGRGHGGHGGPHEANGVTETALTGDDAAKATAAAQAAVPDGTVERAETDAEGAAFEIHMTKSDGTEVTVKLDSNFAVVQTITGRG
jgi:uncharacterized membrane protein YkoI